MTLDAARLLVARAVVAYADGQDLSLALADIEKVALRRLIVAELRRRGEPITAAEAGLLDPPAPPEATTAVDDEARARHARPVMPADPDPDPRPRAPAPAPYEVVERTTDPIDIDEWRRGWRPVERTPWQ